MINVIQRLQQIPQLLMPNQSLSCLHASALSRKSIYQVCFLATSLPFLLPNVTTSSLLSTTITSFLILGYYLFSLILVHRNSHCRLIYICIIKYVHRFVLSTKVGAQMNFGDSGANLSARFLAVNSVRRTVEQLYHSDPALRCTEPKTKTIDPVKQKSLGQLCQDMV